MVELLDLPAEILTKIFRMKCLSQSDTARAALVCKTINAIAVPDLYRQIEFAPYMPFSSFPHPPMKEVNDRYNSLNIAVKNLLVTLATHDNLADLVTCLRLETNISSPYEGRLQFKRIQGEFGRLTFGPRGLTASQIVQSLKNVKSLEINYFWSTILLRGPVLLLSLETAIIQRNHGHVGGIYQLMRQPNLKEIRIDASSPYIFAPSSNTLSSNVSHLTLVTPWGGILELRAFVQMTKNLKSLKLKRALRPCLQRIIGGVPGCHCGTILPTPFSNEISDVLSLVTHSLEVLVVTHCHHVSPHVLDPSRMQSLQNYESLRELKISASMVIGTRVCPALHPGSAPADNQLRCGSFAECMPQNLQKLHVEVAREQLDRDANYCRDIVGSLVKYKRHLPELSLLVMQEVQPQYASACSCQVPDSCYMAKDAVNSSSAVEGILDMQRSCLKSEIELSYLSQRRSSTRCIRTLFIFGQDPQEIDFDQYCALMSGWNKIDLTM